MKQIHQLRAASKLRRGESLLHLRSNQLRAKQIAAIIEMGKERNVNRRYG
jgi:hypothetical protein